MLQPLSREPGMGGGQWGTAAEAQGDPAEPVLQEGSRAPASASLSQCDSGESVRALTPAAPTRRRVPIQCLPHSLLTAEGAPRARVPQGWEGVQGRGCRPFCTLGAGECEGWAHAGNREPT